MKVLEKDDDAQIQEQVKNEHEDDVKNGEEISPQKAPVPLELFQDPLDSNDNSGQENNF